MTRSGDSGRALFVAGSAIAETVRSGIALQPTIQFSTSIFNFELAAVNCYAPVMSRKMSDSHNGFNDVIGFALLAAALLLLVSQWTFDRHDISFLYKSAEAKTIIHNWIGLIGAYLAWFSFLAFGVVAYLLPVLLALFGIAYFLNFFSYLRERLAWSLIGAVVLVISLTGCCHILDEGHWMGRVRESIGSQSAGGWLGYASYGQTANYNFGFSLLGPIGATIVYATLVLISLLFLTNFRLGDWIRAVVKREEGHEALGKTEEEKALEQRRRELDERAKKLQEEVARSGLGADMQPVPEPTVRDLSVPQAKFAGPRVRKTTLPGNREAAPAPPAMARRVPLQRQSPPQPRKRFWGKSRRKEPRNPKRSRGRRAPPLKREKAKKGKLRERMSQRQSRKSKSPAFLNANPGRRSPNPSLWPRRR